MKRWLLGGIVLFLGALLVQLPAAWLAPQLAQTTNGRWRLAAPEGTLWNGAATIYAASRRDGNWQPGSRLRWRILLSELIRGKLAARIEFEDGGGARLAAGAREWSLEELQASFPATQIAALLPSLVSDYGWSGMVNARSRGFHCRWQSEACSGRVELNWRNAASAQLPGPPLGDYRMALTGEGQALRFDVGTERGRLMLALTGELTSDKLRFTGEATAVADDGGRLGSLLGAIARPGAGPGRYLIEYQEQRR